jgi:hypothetical protein
LDYVSFDKLKSIIDQFITIYNTRRYHGAIGYVTPEQKHTGQAEGILKERSERKCLARLHRLNVNRQSVSQLEWKKAARKLASTFPCFGVDNSETGQYKR